MSITAGFIFLIPILILVLAAITAVGVFVYRDAKARGLPAAAWTICAVLLPGFVGLALYLVARTGRSALKCPQCGRRVERTFAVCPYCGEKLKLACPGCGTAVEPDWKVCPNCAAPLPEREPPVKEKEKGLGWLLAICVIIPLVLVIGLICLMVLPLDHGGYSTSRVYYAADEMLAECPELQGTVVDSWLKMLEDEDADIALLWQKQDRTGEESGEAVEILGCYVYLRGYDGETLNSASSGDLLGRVDLDILVTGAPGEEATVGYFQLAADQVATPPEVYLNGQKVTVPSTNLTGEVELPLLFDFYLTDGE